MPGFDIIPVSPIELRFKSDLTFKNYFVLTSRDNYPYPVYIKINKEKDAITEIYPYIIDPKKNLSQNADIILKNKKLTRNQLLYNVSYYFSLDPENLKGEKLVYKTLNNYIWLFNSKCECVKHYVLYNKEEDIPEEVVKFINDMNADYAICYYDHDSNVITDFLFGFNVRNPRYQEIRKELGVF